MPILPKIKLPFYYYFLILSLFLMGMVGCAPSQNAVYQSLKAAYVGQEQPIESATLNPKYRYMRVEFAGRPALLVLGYVDEVNGYPVESWYSANNELIQLKNGRLAGTAGLDFNWINVRYSQDIPLENAIVLRSDLSPADLHSKTAARKSAAIVYQRKHTLMPDYRAEIEETVFLEALSEPPNDVPSRDLARLNLKQIHWVQERIRPQFNDPQNAGLLPLTAYYALDTSTSPARVVYGRQCLAPDYCLSWQVWPPLNKAARL